MNALLDSLVPVFRDVLMLSARASEESVITLKTAAPMFVHLKEGGTKVELPQLWVCASPDAGFALGDYEGTKGWINDNSQAGVFYIQTTTLSEDRVPLFSAVQKVTTKRGETVNVEVDPRA